MSPEQSDIVLLSLFYWALSVLMLRLVIKERRNLLYMLSLLYLALSAGAGWSLQMKWLLAGSLIFMVIAMLSTLWILLKQSRECMNDLKKLKEQERNHADECHLPQ